MLSWPCTQGYPTTGQVMPDGSIRHIEAPPQLDPVSLAKYAYAILWEAVTFSEEHQVPILLDYPLFSREALCTTGISPNFWCHPRSTVEGSCSPQVEQAAASSRACQASQSGLSV